LTVEKDEEMVVGTMAKHTETRPKKNVPIQTAVKAGGDPMPITPTSDKKIGYSQGGHGHVRSHGHGHP